MHSQKNIEKWFKLPVKFIVFLILWRMIILMINDYFVEVFFQLIIIYQKGVYSGYQKFSRKWNCNHIKLLNNKELYFNEIILYSFYYILLL